MNIVSSRNGIFVGYQFGNRTVIGSPFNLGGGGYQAVCECICGAISLVRVHRISRGESSGCKSCSSSLRTHGKSKSHLYMIWASMIARCRRPKDKSYKNYGGRGISVCSEWMYYETFYQWAISNGYASGLSIEREDVNGNYEPNNCSWIPLAQQSENRRNVHRLQLGTEIVSRRELVRRCGVLESSIIYWLKKGLSPDAILSRYQT